MLRLWRPELRVGLCPRELILADGKHAAGNDPLAELGRLGARRRVTVVLSSHFVRHAVLPWSDTLESDEEWLALARHTFETIHGAAARGWDCRVSPAAARQPRLASAIDASLLDALRALGPVVSVQPYLMGAFNARRRSLTGKSGWLVVQEPGRAAIGLFQGDAWRIVRTRRLPPQLHAALPEVLDREATLAGEAACEDIFFYGEEEVPTRLGRYRVTDLSPAPRAAAMACH